ncbi:microtubule-associated protein futsch [Aplysia californica]|uniref:Microtubule-associated protein futsch n=1 Tax=Aplysia californica TaxID=6500 RepID=A0ABM0JGV5_APLCA|nr:microtubule-associated protein futsch [Aplysia californica]
MLRFFRRGNLKKRRSASCPNLAEYEPVTEDGSYKRAEDLFDSSSGSEEVEETESEEAFASRQERLTAQRSIRRVRQREKAKQENVEKNLISLNDYLGKMSELKMWLQEEKRKNVDAMRSPKLREYYKTFMKLWNKRKLPPKYYRGCSVDLPDAVSESPMSRYTAVVQPSTPTSLAVLPSALDISIDMMEEGAAESQFSTFGKSCDADCAQSEASQTQYDVPPLSTKSQTLPSCLTRQQPRTASLKRASPQRFATITRGTPTSMFYVKGDPKVHAVSSPQCPEIPNTPTPNATRTLPYNFQPGTGVQGCNNKSLLEKLPNQLNRSSSESPVYSCVKDAIPYSTGSPKYAEITDDLCRDRTEDDVFCDYTTLSPFKRMEKLSFLSEPTKNHPLNRRRSKSLEDIYAVPSKLSSFGDRQAIPEENSPVWEKTPPVPEKKYSPRELLSSFLSMRNRMSPLAQNSLPERPPPRVITKPSFAEPENMETSQDFIDSFSAKKSPQKRRSQESIAQSEEMPTQGKRSKPSNLSATLASSGSRSTLSVSRTSSVSSTSSAQSSENRPQAKLSILTGSLNPTTRSRKYKEPSVSQLTQEENRLEKDDGLDVIQIQQLEESPKFPRRRLKRRSSGLSITPGKGLTFGRVTKGCASSPRRVSFAKDVKDTEGRPTPRRSNSKRGFGVSSNPPVTRQSQERQQFETFIAAHVSPPKKSNSPVKTNSPNMSPTKSVAAMVGRLAPHLQKRFKDSFKKDLESTICTDNNSLQSQDNPANETVKNKPVTSILKTEASTLWAGPDRIESEPRGEFEKDISISLDKNSAGRIFPPSPQRQVGRRVLGPPTTSSASLNSNSSLNSNASLKKTSENIKVDSGSGQKSSFRFPKKANLPEKTSKPVASQSQSLKKTQSTRASVSSLPKSVNLLVAKFTERTANLCANEVSESDGYSSNEDVLNSRPLSVKSELTVELQKQSSEPGNATDASNKNTVSMLESEVSTSSSKKNFSLDLCSQELINGNSQDTMAKESDSCVDDSCSDRSSSLSQLHESDSGLGGEASNPRVVRKGQHELETALCPEEKPLNVKRTVGVDRKLNDWNEHNSGKDVGGPEASHLWKKNPVKCLSNVVPQQRSQPLRSDSFRTSIANAQRIFEFTNTGQGSSCLTSLISHLDEPGKYQSMECGSSFTEQDNIHEKTNAKDEDASPPEGPAASTLPHMDHRDSKKKENGLMKSPFTKSIETGANEDKMSMELDIDSPVPDKTDGEELETAECLKRMESIRASPKVVENDGWITERRRSSRGKKSQSFRSAHNRFLLRSSSREEALSPEIQQPQSAEVKVGQVGQELSSVLNASDNNIVADMNILSTPKSSKPPSMTPQSNSSEVNTKPRESPPVTAQCASSAQSLRKKAPPIKPKPAVLPKPSKFTKPASYKLNVNNFVNASASQRRKSGARRSSMTMRRESGGMRRESGGMKENYIKKNISAVRRDSGRSSGLSNGTVTKKNSLALKDSRETPQKDSPISSRRDSSKISAQRGGKVMPRRDSKPSVGRDSISTLKKDSLGVAKRRSSRGGKNEDGGHKIASFAERRKFFQQLQEKDKSKSSNVKPLSTRSFRINGRGVQAHQSGPASESVADSRVLRVKTQDKVKPLTLSPSSEMDI